MTAGRGVVPSNETGRQWVGGDEQRDGSTTTHTSDRPPTNLQPTHTQALMGACLRTHVHTLSHTPDHFFALCPHSHTDPSVGLPLRSKERTCRAHVQDPTPRAGHPRGRQMTRMPRTRTHTFVLFLILTHAPSASPRSLVHRLC